MDLCNNSFDKPFLKVSGFAFGICFPCIWHVSEDFCCCCEIISQIQRIKKRVIFLLSFRRFSTNQADLRNFKRQRHHGFVIKGDEIGLIFCKKICAAASALCGDTPVSPSLLVKHAYPVF